MAHDAAVLARFEEKFTRNGPAECWPWHAGTCTSRGDPNGHYGIFCFAGKVKKAHRVSWELYVGPIPAGKLVCHVSTCPNKLCVNPAHLYLAAKNRKQCLDRGHTGEKNCKARMSRHDVACLLAAHAAGFKKALLADHYRLRLATVCDIVSGKRWAGSGPLPPSEELDSLLTVLRLEEVERAKRVGQTAYELKRRQGALGRRERQTRALQRCVGEQCLDESPGGVMKPISEFYEQSYGRGWDTLCKRCRNIRTNILRQRAKGKR